MQFNLIAISNLRERSFTGKKRVFGLSRLVVRVVRFNIRFKPLKKRVKALTFHLGRGVGPNAVC